MDTMQDKISNLKGFLLDDSDSEEEVDTHIKTHLSGTVEAVSTIACDDVLSKDGPFTEVGSDGKARENKKTNLTTKSGLSFTDAVRTGLPKTSTPVAEPKEVESEVDEPEPIPEPIKIKFNDCIDKKTFDKSKGQKPNFMLNPELLARAIYIISKKLGVNIFPEVDLFADEYNKQPGVEMYYHFNQKNKDKIFNAFDQDWSKHKYGYGNFFWPKMHEVIVKAQESGMNLLAFLDVSDNATSYEYFKLYKEHCLVQYNVVGEDLWIHASKDGFQKFSSSHLPNTDGEYAVCFFNFNDKKIVKTSETVVNDPFVNDPVVNDPVVNETSSGRLQRKITTQVHSENGEKLSAHKSEDGTVTLTRSLDQAINTSHDADSVSGEHISNESIIKTLEQDIEGIIKDKSLLDERTLYLKKKEKFEEELKGYETFLQKFKTLL